MACFYRFLILFINRFEMTFCFCLVISMELATEKSHFLSLDFSHSLHSVRNDIWFTLVISTKSRFPSRRRKMNTITLHFFYLPKENEAKESALSSRNFYFVKPISKLGRSVAQNRYLSELSRCILLERESKIRHLVIARHFSKLLFPSWICSYFLPRKSSLP